MTDEEIIMTMHDKSVKYQKQQILLNKRLQELDKEISLAKDFAERKHLYDEMNFIVKTSSELDTKHKEMLSFYINAYFGETIEEMLTKLKEGMSK